MPAEPKKPTKLVSRSFPDDPRGDLIHVLSGRFLLWLLLVACGLRLAVRIRLFAVFWMQTVSHRREFTAIPVNFKLHHYQKSRVIARASDQGYYVEISPTILGYGGGSSLPT